MIRTFINGMKISLIAQLIPELGRNRQQLVKSDAKVKLKIILKILKGYLRSIMFNCIGSGVPTLITCFCPFEKLPFRFLRHGLRVSLTYSTISCAGLIVEKSNRYPAYMGFFGSKAFQMGWALLKAKMAIPTIPFEHYLSFALLSALIGFLSVKTSRKRKTIQEATAEESQKATQLEETTEQPEEGGPK